MTGGKREEPIAEVQKKILEIMRYIDRLCRENGITYCIMGGTALGAVRHGGFIPWDDDLDIFMTPDQYDRFRRVFLAENSDTFVLQEWRTTKDFLEYAKVRMNGTTFIEHCFADRPEMHHGIYVDIMILHKVPKNRLIQRLVYLESKYVTLYGLSQRNWQPKTGAQKAALQMLKLLPNGWLAKRCYRRIYRYDDLQTGFDYCYWITKAGFRQGLFDASFFSEVKEVPFEDCRLYAPARIEEYLTYRYGDFRKLPPESERIAALHAETVDTQRDYRLYFEEKERCAE